MSSLRERNRRHTTEAIHRCAVELVHDLGLDNVTAELIASKAGISQRTFFNYFPYKDAALVPQMPVFSDAARERFQHGQGRLIDDMCALLETVFDDYPHDREFSVKMYKVACQDPRVMALQQAVFKEFEDQLGTLIKARSVNAQPQQSELLASIISSVIRLGFKSWACSDRGGIFSHILTKMTGLIELSTELSEQPTSKVISESECALSS